VNTRPTTDPHASAALSAAIDEVARDASGGYPTRRHRLSTQSLSNEMFHRLEALTEHLGYNVQLTDMGSISQGGNGMFGMTTGWPFFMLRLNRNQTAQQMFSTFIHELTHILLGHNPHSFEDAERRMNAPRPRDGDPHEEAACELAAAAVMKVAGLGDGSQETDFIRHKTRGHPVPQHVKDAANLAARVLWAALNENQMAYAAA
jgi:hypothetical protein